MQDEHPNHSESQFSCGQLVLDLDAKTVKMANELVAVTPLEFNLLAYLMHHQTRPVPVDELLNAVWGCLDGGTSNQVICTVKRLRKKLRLNENTPQYLCTQRGFGFRLCEPDKLPPTERGMKTS